jgi:hypothetical protein
MKDFPFRLNKPREILADFFKSILYVGVAVVGLVLIADLSLKFSIWWAYRLPSVDYVRSNFQHHRADYIRLANSLKKERIIDYLGSDGAVYPPDPPRIVPAYGKIMRAIRAKGAVVGEDGAMEFELGGYGAAIMDDSFMGILYCPHPTADSPNGMEMRVVSSLANDKLPRENGQIASGTYVIPLEQDWFIYRYEYRE